MSVANGTLSERIRKERARLLLTQGELARRLGIALRTVQDWEYGKTFPRARHLAKLAELFDLDAEELALTGALAVSEGSVGAVKQLERRVQRLERLVSALVGTVLDE